MLTEGIIIVLIGMVVVFLFLGVLVAIIYASKHFIKYLPIENQSETSELAKTGGITPEEAAVAIAAVQKFKQK